MQTQVKNRILLIDDNPAIHEDFRKILEPSVTTSSLDDMHAKLFNEADEIIDEDISNLSFTLDSVFQGKDAIPLVREAISTFKPYAIAFVDVRMPPGWDGVKTIKEIMQIDKDIQFVICTAFSDYTWSDMIDKLGKTDRLIILKKPFEIIEIRQIALALTKKWEMNKRLREQIKQLADQNEKLKLYMAHIEKANSLVMLAASKLHKTMKSSSENESSEAYSQDLESVGGKLKEIMDVFKNFDPVKKRDKE